MTIAGRAAGDDEIEGVAGPGRHAGRARLRLRPATTARKVPSGWALSMRAVKRWPIEQFRQLVGDAAHRARQD
jgi:hypothetical protein